MLFKKFETKEGLMGAGSLFLIIGSVAVVIALVLGIIAVSKGDRAMDQNFITVSGEGKATAIPDIATIGYTVRAEAKDVATAQAQLTEQSNAVITALRAAGIDEKDIKTESYTSNPKYEWDRTLCINSYCPPTNQTIVGYEIAQSVSVKVRDINMAGDIVALLGAQKVESMYGPNFSVDDDKDVNADARAQAINDAKAKAKVLADQLGVRLGKIVDFSENGDGYMPMYKGGVAMDSVAVQASPVPPVLPTGENTVTSNVTITYRIK